MANWNRYHLQISEYVQIEIAGSPKFIFKNHLQIHLKCKIRIKVRSLEATISASSRIVFAWGRASCAKLPACVY